MIDSGSDSDMIRSDNLNLSPGTKQVIAFSLFGNSTLYTIGAIRNAEQIPALYPGWIPRFYIDESVPSDIVQQLHRLGAEVIPISHDKPWMIYGRLWRYLALDDEDVNRVMFRDTDTRISTRELEAVNTWMRSAPRYHIMRDHPNQMQLIVPGQWSATAQHIRSRISTLQTLQYISDKYGSSMDDGSSLEHIWLTTFIWPLIKSNVLVHDAFHCQVFESEVVSRPFPGPREWHGDYVGRPIVERFDQQSDYFINGQRELFGGIVPIECRLSEQHVQG